MSTFVIGIDPGLRGCGVAVVENKILKHASYVKNENTDGRGPAAWVDMATAVHSYVYALGALAGNSTTLVQEVMKVYPRQKGDPADLLELNGVNVAIAAMLLCEEYACYFARDWKGQVPKAIHNARIEGKLSPEEKQRIVATPYLRHNAVDAVGIAFYFLKR